MSSVYFWDFDPFTELDTLQRRLDRLYNSAPSQAIEAKGKGTGAGASPVVKSNADLVRPVQQVTWRPHVDVKETDKEIVVHADVPGVHESDLNVSIEDGVLTVSGKREATKKEDNERYHRVERSYGSFARSITLPEGVDATAVKANFENGVLEVRVPKPQAQQPRKVTVSVAKSSKAPAAIEKKEDAKPAPAAQELSKSTA